MWEKFRIRVALGLKALWVIAVAAVMKGLKESSLEGGEGGE